MKPFNTLPYLGCLILFILLFLSRITSGQPQLILGLDYPYSYYPMFAQFSSDGKQVITWGNGDIAGIWDAESGKLIYSLDIGKKKYALFYENQDLIISNDGQWMLSAGQTLNPWHGPRVVKLWQYKTGKIHWIKLEEVFDCPSFSPDGNSIVAVQNSNVLGIWDTESGKLIRTLKGHNKPITTVSFSPDGGYIASGSEDHKVKIWETGTGKLLHTLKRNRGDIKVLIFNPNGKSILAASDAGIIGLWNVTTSKLLYNLQGHKYPIGSACFNPDGSLILSASIDGKILIWDSKSGKLIHIVDHGDKSYGEYDNKTGKLEKEITKAQDDITNAEFSADGSLVLVSGQYGTQVLNPIAGKEEYYIRGDYSKFSPDGKLIVTSSENEGFKICDSKNGIVKWQYMEDIFDHYWPQFSDDGKSINIKFDDRLISWSITPEKPNLIIKGKLKNIRQIHPKDKIAISVKDDSVFVWEIESGKLIYSLKGNNGIFSSDGQWIITSYRDESKNQANNFDKKYEDIISVYEFHAGKIHDVFRINNQNALRSINTDLMQLSTVDNNGVLTKINMITGELENIALKVTNSHFWWGNFQFSPHGDRVISSHSIHGKRSIMNGESKLWNINTGELISTIPWTSCLSDSETWSEFSQNGKYFSIGVDCNNVGIFKSSTGELLLKLNSGGYHYNPLPAFFSQNGKWVATFGDSTRILDFKTGRKVISVSGRFIEFSSSLPLFIVYDNLLYSIVSIKTGETIISWAFLDSSNWVIIHPSGLFDASPGAMERLNFVQDLKITDLDRLKQKYYEPGLWEKVMTGKPLRIVEN